MNVSIDVVSAREGTFTMTCTATGGTVLDSRFNGVGFAPATLAPVGTLNRRGNDVYSFTTPTIRHVDPDSGFPRGDGDTYFCRASNGLSSPDPSDFIALRGEPIRPENSVRQDNFHYVYQTPSILSTIFSLFHSFPIFPFIPFFHSGQSSHHPVS